MRTPKIFVTAASAVAIFVGGTHLAIAAEGSDPIKEGKEIAFDRVKGNCLSCHAIEAEGASLPGNIGPPLKNMSSRFPNKEKLHEQIYDATKNNPNTIMPPFGKHKILTDEELNKVVDFVYTL